MSLPTFTKVGRLSRDIELAYTPSGMAIAKTSIVFSEKYKEKESTCFIDLVAFGKTAETLNQYMQKGHRIEGVFKLGQETWTAQDGTNRSKHALTLERISEFIESKNQTQMDYQGQQQQDHTPPNQYNPPQDQKIPEINIDEDEIPF